MRRLFSAFVLASGIGFAAPVQAADTLELGINELAQEIVRNSRLSHATTIAVASFPHANNTCSELSNYIVDELVLSLFLVPDAGLQIIERAQLQTIIAELSLGLTGAVDANTAREIGRIHGVDSLVVGSLTVVGDRLRVIARMIGTETGTVYAAAATTIPMTDTVTALIGRSAGGGGCGLMAGALAGAGAPPGAAQPAPQAILGPEHQSENPYLRATLISAALTEDRKTISAIVRLESLSEDQSVRLLLYWATAFDSRGTSLGRSASSGITYCELSGKENCARDSNVDWNDYTLLYPKGTPTTIEIRFQSEQPISVSSYFNFSIEFIGRVGSLNSAIRQDMTVSFTNVQL